MKLLICLFAVLAVAQKQPTFSNNWYSTLDEDAAVFQGDYSFIPAMGYCCSEESNCQVQVEYINSTFYQDYTNNRTRQDAIDMDQTIITDFTIMKEMLVDPTSMDCLEYCPTDGETLTPGFLAPNSTDLGPTVIDGVKVEEWMYQQKPLGPKTKWVVETSYVFVNQAPNPAVPVQENDILTPFGFEIGAANTYWSDFVSQMPKASLFNVNNVNSCPMSNGCNDDTSILGQRRHRNRPRHHQTFRNSAAVRAAAAPEQAHAKKVVPPLPRKPKHAPVSVVKGQKPVQSSQPVFPNDWTAFQEDWEVQYQGDFTQSSEMYCCQLNSNCNIETGYDRGMFYFDFTNNRTRFDDEYAGTVEIVDFTAQMDMMVDPTNLTCLNYCPLLGETLEPGFLDPSAIDEGSAVINGVPVEDWRWNSTFAFWVMEVSDVFVDQSQNPPVPVQEIDQFTPFGQNVGGGVTAWSQFTPGTPPASLFAVQGMKNCPQNGQCEEATAQTRRIKRKLYNTWRHYEEKKGRKFPSKH